MNTPPVCRDCAVPMTIGMQVDHTDQQFRLQARWVPGLPQTRGWLRWNEVDRAQYALAIPITTFRCPECGLLDSYAWPPPPPSE